MRREALGVQAVSPSTSHQQSQDAMTGICIPDANQSQYPLHHSDTVPALTEEHDATRGASPHNRLRRMLTCAGFFRDGCCPDRQGDLVTDEGEWKRNKKVSVPPCPEHR
jgi:hypothetical protein